MPPVKAGNDEIVISGISGRFPECASLEEFQENLFAGVDLVTENDRRWPKGYYGLPTRMGTLKNLELFDAFFFGVNAKQAEVMDPQLRIMLELTYEALIDAGINPVEVRGSKTGVFVGISTCESKEYWSSDPEIIHGYGLLGCSFAMMANRISYTFDFTGPSYSLDAACATGMYALDQAVAAMQNGSCEAAIVACSNLLLKPTVSLQFNTMNMLSSEGMCKSFDESGNGYVRSEAIVVIYLQKSSTARRVYTTVVGSKTNTDGYKDLGITFPSSEMQHRLIKELYDEIDVVPSTINYIEAHGTGTRAGDPQELNSEFVNTFCQNRKEPLLVGSVKSNMGHSEPAAGLCAIAKVIIAMETRVIPQNLHFKTPNPHIPALLDGTVKVVAKNQPWNGGYVGINCFGFGGSNSHVLLKSNPKPKLTQTDSVVPRLFTVSGRTDSAVNTFLNKLDEYINDDELMALIHEIHKRNVNGHEYRGFVLAGDKKVREINQITAEKRPIWFVYTGMGCQWSGFGKDMMKLEVFRKAIEKCSRALQPYGINLKELITNEEINLEDFTTNESDFEATINSLIIITSTQIALTDVLMSIGIKPDGIVGHSLGEIGCAYADGTLTVEQAILASYFRGIAILESKSSEGAMASIGLTWENCKEKCPEKVYPACHNSADNVTISGPPEAIDKFVEELSSKKIFAKHVNSSGRAFHSKYIASVGPIYLEYLKKIISQPKERTSRWISSSVPQSEWFTTSKAKYSSAEYHTNNLLCPVLFYEATKHIPQNAITIELSPHDLLLSLLKRNVGPNSIQIGLMNKKQENNLEFFMSNLGKLYNAGVNPNLSKLYKQISFPVGRGTPMLQSMVEWDHSEQWAVASFTGKGSKSGEAVISVDISTEVDNYINAHSIDGRVLFPATGYLTLVWRAVAKLRNEDYEKLAVIFEKVHIHHITIMPKTGAVKFHVHILEGTGEFEICEGGSVVVTGKVTVPINIDKEFYDLPKPVVKEEKKVLSLTAKDIYKELHLRGYTYGESFHGIHEADNRGQKGLLKWNNNWVTFTDAILQFSALSYQTQNLRLPTRFQKIVIDPRQLLNYINSLSESGVSKHVPVYMYQDMGIIKSVGVQIQGLKTIIAQRRQIAQPPPKHERYIFVSFENNNLLSKNKIEALNHSLTVILQIVLQNTPNIVKLRIAELIGNKSPEELLAPMITNIIEIEPDYADEYQIYTSEPVDKYKNALSSNDVKIFQKDLADTNLHLIVGHDLLGENKLNIISQTVDSLKEGGMLLLVESKIINMQTLNQTGLEIICRHHVGSKTYLLLRRGIEIPSDSIVMKVTEKNFDWVEPLANAIKTSEANGTKVYVVVENEEQNGIMGMMTCILREPGGDNVRAVFIQDQKSEKFSLKIPFYVKQLKKDLTFNVLKNDTWGTYRHLLLDEGSTLETRQVEHAYINALTYGDLSSFRWIESPLKYYKQKNPNQELCSVYYSALNFRDAMIATGKLSPDALPDNLATQECLLGLEFAGRDSQGQRVMGMVAGKSLATSVVVEKSSLWNIPNHWTMEEACTTPVVYTTAYYALIVRGRIRPGESILIHAGTGGVGQAAITLALHMGCTVYTTVSTQEKRDFIKTNFPQLTDNHIGNSRDTSFEQFILHQTKGQGVDLVLNSLSEEKLQASLKCLTKHGRFLEIGKVDFSNNNLLEMSIFLKNITFHGILSDALSEPDNWERKEVVRLMAEGIKSEAVRPLPTTVFGDDQIEQAFRLISSGKHIGKVVIKIRDEEKKQIQKPAPKLLNALSRTYMNPDKSYIVVGGLGGLGLEFTGWLISRGANKIIIVSRNGITTGYRSFCVRRWRETGTPVIILTKDLTTESGAKSLLEEANKLGPIGGIFNLAAVIKDGIMINQTKENFRFVCLPKIEVTKNLDKLSRVMCPQLEYFVACSSFSCGRGNGGQSNYGFANSTLERICEARKSAGYPSLAIQWSAIGDVGLTMDLVKSNEKVIRGTYPQVIPSCLQTVDKFLRLQDQHSILCSLVVAEKADKSSSISGNTITAVEAVGKILGIRDVKFAPQATSLLDLGLDSLMGDEVKQTLERNYDIVLKPHEIRSLTFEKLNEMSNEFN